jgi:hypothetical protein
MQNHPYRAAHLGALFSSVFQDAHPEPLAIVARLTITFSTARLVCRAPLIRNITVLTGIVVANLIWANAQAAPVQLATPTDERQQARRQFDSFAACIAYWKIVRQCLPPGLTQKDVSRLRQSLERLQSAAAQHLGQLGRNAQLSEISQQAIVDRKIDQIFTSIGTNCRNVESAVRTYRDRCAALFKDVAEWKKE